MNQEENKRGEDQTSTEANNQLANESSLADLEPRADIHDGSGPSTSRGSIRLNHNQTIVKDKKAGIESLDDLPLSDERAEATKGGENLTLNGSGDTTDDGPTTNVPIKIKRPTK